MAEVQAGMSSALDRLRPHPHRGDLIAAGAVPLAVAAFVIELRMTQWSLGPRFAVVALIAGLLLSMGWLAELEREGPRAYHSILLTAGLLPSALALVLLAEVLGATDPPGSGGLTWTFAAEAALAALAARRANSGACTLIAAVAAVIAVEAFVAWVFHPHGLGTFRAILLVLTIALIVGVVRLRDRRRRHAVQLANTAGLLALTVAATYLATTFLAAAVSRFFPGSPAPSQIATPFGWKLFVLAIAFGLIAYAAVDREPGPAYIGVAVLGAFVLLVGLPTGERGSLVGWPLLLLVLGAAGVGIGLRPRRPLPPEPWAPDAATGAPTVPLRPADPKP